MKSMNFIKPVPHTIRACVGRWILFSTLTFTTLLIALTAITIHQLYNLYHVESPVIAQTHHEPIDIQPHETKLSELEKLHTKLTTNKNKQRTPALALKEIQKHAQAIEITNISFLPHKQYKLEGIAPGIENITALLKSLGEADHIHGTTITLIQPVSATIAKGVQFTLMGYYRTNL